MKNFLFIILLCLLVTKVNSQDRWVWIGSTYYFDVYYDTETIKFNKNEITVNIKTLFNMENTDSKENKDLEYTIGKEIHYCGKDQYYMITITNYYRGNKIDTTPINSFVDVIPDSIGETIHRYLCNLIKQ